MLFATRTIDSIAHPTGTKPAALFKIIRLIAEKYVRPDERANLQNHLEALKTGRYALELARPDPAIAAVTEQVSIDAEEMADEAIRLRRRRSFWTLYGLLADLSWRPDGETTPYMTALPSFGEVVLAKQDEIARLSRGPEQSSQATYLGLVAKELYWDFKTQLEAVVTEPLIRNRLAAAGALGDDDGRVLQGLRVGYKQNVLRIW